METQENKSTESQTNYSINDYHKHSRGGRFFGGLIILSVGVLLLLKQLGTFVFPEWLFTWPTFLVVLGIYIGVRHGFRFGAWLIPILIGGLYLTEEFYPNLSLSDYITPIVIISVGLILILKPKKKRRDWYDKNYWESKGRKWEKYQYKYGQTQPAGGHSQDDFIDSVSIFSGHNKVIVSKDFKGGDIVNIFGGSEINLTQADIKGTVVMEIVQIFGGTKIIVPADWEVQLKGVVSVFAGVEDNRDPSVSKRNPDKVLLIFTSAMPTATLTTRKIYVFVAAVFVVGCVFQYLGMIRMGFSIRTSAIDCLVSNGVLMLIGIGVKNNMRFRRPEKIEFFYAIAFIFFMSITWITLIQKWIMAQLITEPNYMDFFQKSALIRVFIAFLMTGFFTLLFWLQYTLEEKSENDKRKAEADRLEKDAELYKLRQQLHPHFLFNSLNSISSLTGSRPEEARHMIQQLADFLRGTLKNDEKLMVNLEEELHYLGLYLDIEKVRFGHRLSTEIKHDEASLKCQIPQMLLQPIVENAIKFGLYDTTGNVTITIDVLLNKGVLTVTIQNPFDPQTAQTRSGTGFGLSSIQRRLYLLYARKDLIETKAENNLFTTTVTIPQ